MEQKEKEKLEFETYSVNCINKRCKDWDEIWQEIREIVDGRIDQKKMTKDPNNKCNRFWLYFWPDEKNEEKIIIWFGQLTEEVKFEIEETFPNPNIFYRYDKRGPRS